MGRYGQLVPRGCSLCCIMRMWNYAQVFDLGGERFKNNPLMIHLLPTGIKLKQGRPIKSKFFLCMQIFWLKVLRRGIVLRCHKNMEKFQELCHFFKRLFFPISLLKEHILRRFLKILHRSAPARVQLLEGLKQGIWEKFNKI